MQIIRGDILLTRNLKEEDNQTPGYYNHASLFIVKNWILEAQATPDCVIAVPIWNFFERYPEILVLRPPEDIARRTAEIAPQYIGREYRTYMSVRPLWRWKGGDNCTSVIRRIYNVVTGCDYKWRIPDDFLKTEWLKPVALKRDYKNHVEVEDHQKGAISIWFDNEAYYVG